MEIEKKMRYIWINKNKHSSDNNRKRYHRENRRGSKSWGKVKETGKVQYLEMVINSEGNLKDHIRQVETKTNNIYRVQISRSQFAICEALWQFANLFLYFFYKLRIAKIRKEKSRS